MTSQRRRFTDFSLTSSRWHVFSLILFLEFLHSTWAHYEIACHHLLNIWRHSSNKRNLISSLEPFVHEFLTILVILIEPIITLKIFIFIVLCLASIFVFVWFVSFIVFWFSLEFLQSKYKKNNFFFNFYFLHQQMSFASMELYQWSCGFLLGSGGFHAIILIFQE